MRVQLPKYNSETFSNFFKKNKDFIDYEAKNNSRKVVIYSTCFVNFNKKNTGVAALKVLKKNGVEVQEAYPGCCGMPFLEQADLPKVVEQAKKVSKDLLEWTDKGYKVNMRPISPRASTASARLIGLLLALTLA